MAALWKLAPSAAGLGTISASSSFWSLVSRVSRGRVVSTRGRVFSTAPAARPAYVLDQWVSREIRPVSLRQLMVFGRSLTESRLISSANYVRTELPCRLAHRIRDIQLLPYHFVVNPHIKTVYNLYYDAFDAFSRVAPIRTLEDNDRFCETITRMLQSHLSVIPKLALGVLQSAELVDADELDSFMNTILRSRISRRVIAEQHLSLTSAFKSPPPSSYARLSSSDGEYIGQVFTKCVARDVIENVYAVVRRLARATYGPAVVLPNITFDGHLDTSFPYILSHLEYIVGELLRNSVRALVENQKRSSARPGGAADSPPPPIEVTICASPQTVVIRICDRGGGVPRNALPYLWSFSKGPHSEELRENLAKVPKMAATLQEVHHPLEAESTADAHVGETESLPSEKNFGSLSSLTHRPPNLQLGVSLPMSRVYAEYWAGKLELHSLQGYGVDAFLQVSRLGNQNEQLSTRATMDGV